MSGRVIKREITESFMFVLLSNDALLFQLRLMRPCERAAGCSLSGAQT